MARLWQWVKWVLRIGWAPPDADSDRYDLYTVSERRIYRHMDGTGIVRKDPLVLYKKLKDVWPELTVDLQLADSIHSEADKGYDQAIAKIKKIFDVDELDQKGGLTRGEIRSLLDHFLIYVETVKKNSRLSAMPSREASPSTVPTPAAAPATPNTLDFGSTANASAVSNPSPSPAASPLPSDSPTPAESISSP